MSAAGGDYTDLPGARTVPYEGPRPRRDPGPAATPLARWFASLAGDEEAAGGAPVAATAGHENDPDLTERQAAQRQQAAAAAAAAAEPRRWWPFGTFGGAQPKAPEPPPLPPPPHRRPLPPRRPVRSTSAVPSAVFLGVSLSFALLGRSPLLPSLLAFLLLLAALPICVPPERLRDRPPTFAGELLPLAMLLSAVVLGALDGLYAHEAYFGPFLAVALGRSYDNVLASTPAAAYADAGRVRFAETSRVQDTLALGYRVSPTYCVAPVTDSGQTQARTVSFWAVGLDCCGARGSFACGSGNGTGGVRAPPDGLFWCLETNFLQAAREAAAVGDLVLDGDAVFLRWVEDPAHELRLALLGAAGVLGLGAALFVLLTIAALAAGSLDGAAAADAKAPSSPAAQLPPEGLAPQATDIAHRRR